MTEMGGRHSDTVPGSEEPCVHAHSEAAAGHVCSSPCEEVGVRERGRGKGGADVTPEHAA